MNHTPDFTSTPFDRPASSLALIGVLPGEGIGPEVVHAALSMLPVVTEHTGLRFELRTGGDIGKPAIAQHGQALTPEVTHFAQDILGHGGALFCGAGGERFVYELRRELDLYCKIAPIQPLPAMWGSGVLQAQATSGVDLLVVRENTGGVYQGQWDEHIGPNGREATHQFRYDSQQVERIVRTAIELAQQRRGKLCVTTKPGGVPSISRLWDEVTADLCQASGVALQSLEIDNACYQVIAQARQFDVIVTPNLFGDVLADTAALLLGGRGLSTSANFNAQGHGVYQTGHGAAHDLAGTDRANPVGQILSLAFMLHTSFGAHAAARALATAVDHSLASGLRTADMAGPGHRVCGTQALADDIRLRFAHLMGQASLLERAA